MLWARNRTGLQGRLSSAMQRYRVSAAAVLLCLASGCSTFSETFADRPHAASLTYIGTRVDVAVIGAAGDESAGLLRLFWPFALLDLPLSLSADTLLLPYTLYQDTAAKRPASDRNRH